MKLVDWVLQDAAAAIQILFRQGVFRDAGEISVRDPSDPRRFAIFRPVDGSLLQGPVFAAVRPAATASRSDDTADHAALYAARPDINAIVMGGGAHTAVFASNALPIRPILHNHSVIGRQVRFWRPSAAVDEAGEASERAVSLPAFMGADPALLVAGHGTVVVAKSIRRAVFVAVSLEMAARLQLEALQLGDPMFLTDGEIDRVSAVIDRIDTIPGAGVDRAWEYWCDRAGATYQPMRAGGSGWSRA